MLVLVVACVVWFPPGRVAAQAQASGEVLTNDAIVQMITAKVGKGLILAKIQSTRNTFDTTANGLVTLYASRVPNDVIGAMLAATAPGSEVLTNDDVIKMVTSQLPKDLIVTKIRSTTPGFDLTTTGLIALSQNKVPQDVQTAMMTATAAPRSAAALSAPTLAGPDPDASEISRARSVLEIDKQPDGAIQILQAIQQNHALSAAGLTVLGRAYLAEDDGADAKDAFRHALATGAEIAIDLQHYHVADHCVGTLYISATKVRWVSDTSPEETLNVPASQVMPGSALNFLSLNVDAKRWNFEYLLYGKQNSYFPGFNHLRPPVALSKKADAVLQDVIVSAKSTQVIPPVPAAPVAATPQAAPAAPQTAPASPAHSAAASQTPSNAPNALPNFAGGESTDDVQKAMGKPSQVVPDAKDRDTVVWIYATVKITFHLNKLVDVVAIKAEAVAGAGA
jgi:hypothetical protein